jgi:hypothetical protein
MAAPVQELEDKAHPLGRPELYRENSTSAGYEIIYYGALEETASEERREEVDTADLHTRDLACYFSEDPECDSNNGAASDVCETLVNDLYANPDVTIEKAPRQMCATGSNGYCCVSWSKEIDGLYKKHFADNAETSK